MSARAKEDKRPSGNVHGILIVDKPPGLTSHQVVGHVRRAFGTRKVGHAGTLDPMATGVLVVLLGEATKLSSILTTERKGYDATVCFGSSTDTLDADGKIVKQRALENGWLSPLSLEAALENERTRRLQIPPQVSAIKVDGQRAYARARRGEVTDLNARDVQVHDLVVKGQSQNTLRLSLLVSKGYYVRSLARDLGDSLDVPSHLSELRRTTSGPFSLADAHTWPVTNAAPLLSISDAVRLVLPSFEVTEDGALRASQGKRLEPSHFCGRPPEGNSSSPTPICAIFREGRFLALVEPSGDGEFRVKRGINDPGHPAESCPESTTA